MVDIVYEGEEHGKQLVGWTNEVNNEAGKFCVDDYIRICAELEDYETEMK